jgi:hypothetical protein
MPLSKRSLFISRLALLISLTLVIQIAGFPQPITGPLINMLLFITVTLLGWIAGAILGCLTPLIALIRGQLPAMLAPLVPFIAIANTILVLVYFLIYSQILKRTNLVKWLKIIIAVIFAAIAKYLFFILTVKIIFPLIVNFSLPDNVVIILMTPQLLTALVGGVLFLILLNILNRSGLWHESS